MDGWIGWMGGRTVGLCNVDYERNGVFYDARIHEISCETISNPFDKYTSIIIMGPPCKYDGEISEIANEGFRQVQSHGAAYRYCHFGLNIRIHSFGMQTD